jgi:phosphoserine phosphatase RsbU/P
MQAVPASTIHQLQPKILERRERLKAAAHYLSADYLNQLLAEVDAALSRIEDGSYGLCETCHDTIEAGRLECDPLLRFCLDHLTGEQLRAHEQDLALATAIQAHLLPAEDITAGGWETHFRYLPAGVVGGDYCDVVPAADRKSLFFAVGDVTGKGVAASLLMTHLNAIFRSLLSLDLPLAELMARANRLFCESTPATHYATLAAGRTTADGIELSSAGHCRPLLVGHDRTECIDSTGLPLGLFSDGRYAIRQLRLEPGESVVLYSDGITDAQNPEGEDYEEDRLIRALRGAPAADASTIADGVLRDVTSFRSGCAQADDMTLLIVRRRR